MGTGRTRAQRREQAVALLAEGSAMSTGLTALLLSVSPKTVARWCREGTIKAFRPGGDGQWRVDAADIAKRLLGPEPQQPVDMMLTNNKGDRP